ncbi:MAG: hypothetical protein NC907_01070 [Candidatus Omnitrophica bacterium]|nr:hypothetical protein [Candidatus Omnitrophota bacterium]
MRFGAERGYRWCYWMTGLPGWIRARMGLPAWGAGVGPGCYIPFSHKITPQQEADILRKQAEAIQDELRLINERIKILEELTSEEKK